MTIETIYEKYKIFSGLREHQLRVAAIGKMTSEAFPGKVDQQHVVSALLLHDMGNLIKVRDFDILEELWEPEGKEYWKGVQQEFVETYGEDEHHAALLIAKDIGVSETTYNLMNFMGFTQLLEVQERGSIENKICSYADMRVSPTGITSLAERLQNLADRYSYKGYSQESREPYWAAVREFQEELFEQADISPTDINDESAAPVIEELKQFVVV